MQSKEIITQTKFRMAGGYRERWWLRPICWFEGHIKKIINPYGIRAKQCKRCGKYSWKKVVQEEAHNIFRGEIGELYGVRFIVSKRKFK